MSIPAGGHTRPVSAAWPSVLCPQSYEQRLLCCSFHCPHKGCQASAAVGEPRALAVGLFGCQLALPAAPLFAGGGSTRVSVRSGRTAAVAAAVPSSAATNPASLASLALLLCVL